LVRPVSGNGDGKLLYYITYLINYSGFGSGCSAVTGPEGRCFTICAIISADAVDGRFDRRMYAGYDYFSTGEKTELSWAARNTDYQFLGKEFDEESDFDKSYLGARYYDSKAFQFISPEPLMGPRAAGNKIMVFTLVRRKLYYL
jgi:RHS repeat-associated protein